MKAEELMIGDWVNWDGIGKTIPVIITRISPENDNRQYHPIPLTSDILRANFPDNKYGVYWSWDYNRGENTSETWYQIRIDTHRESIVMGLRYVHELQHLLRLCGIEKNIEIYIPGNIKQTTTH